MRNVGARTHPNRESEKKLNLTPWRQSPWTVRGHLLTHQSKVRKEFSGHGANAGDLFLQKSWKAPGTHGLHGTLTVTITMAIRLSVCLRECVCVHVCFHEGHDIAIKKDLATSPHNLFHVVIPSRS